MKCTCPCKGDASWLMTGYDYDPKKPGKRGERFVNQPACDAAAVWCEENASMLGLPFERKPICASVGSKSEHEPDCGCPVCDDSNRGNR